MPMLVVCYEFLRHATDADMKSGRFSSHCQYRDDVPGSVTG